MTCGTTNGGAGGVTHGMDAAMAHAMTNGAPIRRGEEALPGFEGELLYEYRARLTDIRDFGVSLADVLTGRAALPPGGLRVDISFAGDVEGRLGGRVEGCDYLEVRADGRMQLDIKATITTPTGARIALAAGGVALPQPGSTASLLRENVRLTTADPAYAWVNPLEIWAVGRADVATGELFVRGYLPR